MPKIGINHPLEKGALKDHFLLNGFTLQAIHKQDLQSELRRLDGIVLYAIEGHEAIYEWIVEVRKQSTIPMWVCVPTKKVKIQSLLYLHLGVDGVFEAEDIDEMVVSVKRTLVQHTPSIEVKTKSAITLIPEKLTLKVDKNEVELTKLEYRLVVSLLEHPDDMMGYQKLSDLVWDGSNEKGTKAQLANLVCSVRNKLKPYEKDILIKTIRTKGYSLVQ